MNSTTYGIIFIIAGLFTMAGAFFNWEWFINSRKTWLIRKFIGRTGARIFYAILGLVITVIGGLVAAGIIER